MGSADGLSHDCSDCGEEPEVRPFDLIVRDPAGHERLFFGLLAALCRGCGSLVLDDELARLIGLGDEDSVSAIASDLTLRPA